MPLVLAMLFLLVPRLYLGQDIEGWTRIDGKKESNFFIYFWKVLPTLPTNLSWLWFLPVLFIAMVLNYPMLAFTYRRKNNLPLTKKEDGALFLGQHASLLFWAAIGFITVSSKDYVTYFLPSIVVLLLFYYAIFAVQFLFVFDWGYKASVWMKLIGPVFCLVMNLCKYGTFENNLFGMLLGMHYQIMFMAQGILDRSYHKEYDRYKQELSQTLLSPFILMALFFSQCITMPTNYTNTGFLFYYPLYFDYGQQCLFTLGTWQQLYLYTTLLEAVANQKFNDFFFKHFTASSLWGYLSHYVFIVIAANLFIIPFKPGFVATLLILYSFSILCITITYYLLFVLLAGSMKKKKQQKQKNDLGKQ